MLFLRQPFCPGPELKAAHVECMPIAFIQGSFVLLGFAQSTSAAPRQETQPPARSPATVDGTTDATAIAEPKTHSPTFGVHNCRVFMISLVRERTRYLRLVKCPDPPPVNVYLYLYKHRYLAFVALVGGDRPGPLVDGPRRQSRGRKIHDPKNFQKKNSNSMSQNRVYEPLS